VALDGLEKQGKTHFALTAPAPIVVFNFDIGLEGVVDKFADKKVYVVDYNTPGTVDQSFDWTGTWEKFKTDYRGMFETDARTIVMDTATEAWELLRMARFGKLTEVMPQHYGPVNAEYRELLRLAYNSDKNLVLIHKLKDEYVNNQRTGKFKRAGFGDTGYMSQVNCRMERDEDLEFTLEVEDCRQNALVAGEVMEGPMCAFPWLASMVFTGTGPDDWE